MPKNKMLWECIESMNERGHENDSLTVIVDGDLLGQNSIVVVKDVDYTWDYKEVTVKVYGEVVATVNGDAYAKLESGRKQFNTRWLLIIETKRGLK